MSNQSGVPNAWDDDYEIVADRKTQTPANVVSKSSRAERKAQHAQANKQLWDSADNPETFHFVEASQAGPVKSDFKPALKVLSRKPKPVTTPLENGIRELGLGSQDAEDDSEEEARKQQLLTLEERKRKAQLEREEKQRRYKEVRDRLFGTGKNDTGANNTESSGASTASTRIGRGNGKKSAANNTSQSPSSNDQSPARSSNQTRKLYDPSSNAKLDAAYLQKRDANRTASPIGPQKDNRPVRNPRGPDGSGRGGFGFAPRGNKGGVT